MDYSYPIRVATNKFPTRTALVFREEQATYEDVERNVNKLANALLNLGLAGQRVASILLNEPITVYLYMALSRIGATSVPINVRLTQEEKEYIVRDSGATVLVADPDHLAEAIRLGDRVPELRSLFSTEEVGHSSMGNLRSLSDKGSEQEVEREVEESSISTVMYTSGTTGFPKGVVRTQRSNLWNVVNSALGSPRVPEDIELFNLPIFGIGFIHFAMPALLAGATVILDQMFHPERVWRLLKQYSVTRTFLAPTMVDSMLSIPGHERFDLSALEIIYTAYDFPERLRARALERFGNRFVYMYGLTEAQLTSARPGEFARDPTNAGKPMGLMRIKIVAEDGQTLSPGGVGQIAFEGPSSMAGYHGLPDATAEALREGWVHTGDLGYLDAENNLHFAGRKKEIIKTGGFSVDPVEVENVLLGLDGVREAAVVGVPDEHWGEMVVAFAVASSGIEVSESEIISFCKDRLADFKVPKKVLLIDELPKNPTGKVERGRLRQSWRRMTSAEVERTGKAPP
jgi:acyl-CoA synthetase (AMP-forming)/AMP-acid ligase II